METKKMTISYSSEQQTFVTKSRSPSNPCSQGTIQILHTLFDWVGGFRNWPFFLTNSAVHRYVVGKVV